MNPRRLSRGTTMLCCSRGPFTARQLLQRRLAGLGFRGLGVLNPKP